MDGKISLKEFDLLFAKADATGELPPLKAMLAQLRVVRGVNDDKDRSASKTSDTSGSIDHDVVKKIFELLDEDNSKSLDTKEVSDVLQKMGIPEATCREIMIGCDVDMDGVVTLKELDLVLAKAFMENDLPPLEAVLAQMEVIKKKSTVVDDEVRKAMRRREDTFDHGIARKIFALLDKNGGTCLE